MVRKLRVLEAAGRWRVACALAVFLCFSLAREEAVAQSARCGPARLDVVMVQTVRDDGDILLSDGRLLRAAGLHPQSGVLRQVVKAGERIGVGLLGGEADRWGRLPALLFRLPEGAAPQWIQAELLREGRMLARPEAELGSACWALLTAAERSFSGKAVTLPAEPARFSRVEGRVSRVGEGRSAHFVTVYTADGVRMTGVVQKRFVRRFQEGGVDLKTLNGHIIRMRGTRGLRNPATMALLRPEQIEIVR